MLIVGLFVLGAASLIGGFATTPGELIAARAVMGLGAAMTFPATLSLLTDVFTSRKVRALSIGLWGATAGAAIALGRIVGGFLLANYAWPSIFYVLGPVSLLVIGLVGAFVPRSRDPRPHRLELPGLVLSAGFMRRVESRFGAMPGSPFLRSVNRHGPWSSSSRTIRGTPTRPAKPFRSQTHQHHVGMQPFRPSPRPGAPRRWSQRQQRSLARSVIRTG